MPSGAFNICCPRDCVSRHNGGNSGAPLKPLRVDSALRALSTLRGLRGAPEVPPLCRETQSLGQQMLNAPFGINGLMMSTLMKKMFAVCVMNCKNWSLQNYLDYKEVMKLRAPNIKMYIAVLDFLRFNQNS